MVENENEIQVDRALVFLLLVVVVSVLFPIHMSRTQSVYKLWFPMRLPIGPARPETCPSVDSTAFFARKLCRDSPALGPAVIRTPRSMKSPSAHDDELMTLGLFSVLSRL